MTPLAFCIPGDIDLPTGGYRYDREVLKRLPSCGIAVQHVRLGPGFPHPSPDQIEAALAAMAAVDRRSLLLIDGLALGALPPERIARLRHRKIALVHHPLGLEAGTPPDRARFLMSNEADVLAETHHVIVTSDSTKRCLVNQFGVKAQKISVAEPGTARRERSRCGGAPIHVLAVGAVSPRKAYDLLVEALAASPDLDWRLTIVGKLDLSRDAASSLENCIARHDLAGRVSLSGALGDEELGAHYAAADLFAMSSLYEGYGMALTEALAHGLPIVTSTGGAAAETVPDSAALKVPPGDAQALAAALRTVLDDAALRRRMADAAWAAAALLPTWDDTTRGIADVVKSI